MKVETKKILKEQGKLDLYTDERFEQVKAVMKHGQLQRTVLGFGEVAEHKTSIVVQTLKFR